MGNMWEMLDKQSDTISVLLVKHTACQMHCDVAGTVESGREREREREREGEGE